MEVYPQRIPRPRMIVDAVNDFLLFLGKRAEDLVPDDQKLAKIFIQIWKIDAVMYAVVRRRGEIFFKPAELADKFGVVQERDKEVNAAHHVDVKRLKTDEREREKEQERA